MTKLRERLTPEVVLGALAVLLAVVALYFFQGASQAAGDLENVERQVSRLESRASDEIIQDLEVTLADLRDAPPVDPFLTREEMVRHIAGLRGAVEGTGARLTSPATQEEISVSVGSGTSSDRDGGGKRVYPGVALGLEAAGSPQALLKLLDNLKQAIPGLVMKRVSILTLAGREDYSLVLAIEMYYRPAEAMSGGA